MPAHAQNKVLFFCLFLFSLVLYACGSSEKDTGAAAENATSAIKNAYENATPVPGGRIIMASLGDATNLIPPLSSDLPSHEITDLLYVAPLKYDQDLNIITWAADSWEVQDEGKKFVFTLKPGILWDDGIELTAEDVEFTYKLMIDPKTPTAYAEDFKAIASFKVTGRYSFEVTYDQPFARAQSTWMSAILPKHALEGQDLVNTPLSRKPLSGGSYRLKEWVSGSRITLGARDEYFEGRPYLDEAVTMIIPDLATMFMELKAGNLDMMRLSPQQYMQQTVGKAWQQNFNKYRYLLSAYTYLGFNLSSPLFSDARVRRAISMSIDKDEIVKAVLLGQGIPTIGPYKPDTWPYNTDIKDYPFDPDAAADLLAEAGWTRADKKAPLKDKDGNVFAFTITTNQGNDQRIKTATIIQSRLADLGMEVKIRAVEWAVLLKEFLDKGRFDAVIMGWTIPLDPDMFDIWHSSKVGPGNLNFIGYKNPEVDRLLEKGRHILDQDERKIIYDQVQEILHQEQPYCFIYVPYELPIVQARFQGIVPTSLGITYDFIKWWVPRELQKKAPTNIPLKS